MQHRLTNRGRRSVRLKGYDYAAPSAYFVTVCTQDRACMFGEVVDGVMCPTDAGRMVKTVWDELPVFYPGVAIDGFVAMPNHIHGIIILVGATPRGRPVLDGRPDSGHEPAYELGNDSGRESADDSARGSGHESGQAWESGYEPGQADQPGQARGPAPTGLSLADVVHRFKTMTTKRYVDGVKQLGWPHFCGRLWQRNYFEHIIRNEAGLNRTRRYIDENPLRWASDEENPRRVTA